MSKIVAFMEKDAINSGKGRVYLEIDHTLDPWMVDNSMSLRLAMENDSRVKSYKADGYVGPKIVVVFDTDLDDELSKVSFDVDRGGWTDSHTRNLNIAFKQLTMAKKLYDAGLVDIPGDT